jgi:ubiquinone/menaquinone biosynthesis C-methylase UbiE
MKKRMPDKRCADGVLAECYRVIRKGGRIKFANLWWKDERLAEFKGDTVLLWPDYYMTELTVFAGPKQFAYTIKQGKP